MEKKSHPIELMIREKLSLYQLLNKIMNQERQAIVDMDVEALWRYADQKKQIVLEISQVRTNLLAYVDQQFHLEEMTAASFSLSYLVKWLPIGQEIKARLRKLKLAVEGQKDELARVARENMQYVREYLGVIDDIMSVVVGRSENARYNPAGTLPRGMNAKRLIHAEV